ncbi:MAG: lytic murein transglycosylase [Rhodobacteraceae bacterium]|nr:lytic murein transglycosylase [Paracoccaceae bacterium]
MNMLSRSLASGIFLLLTANLPVAAQEKFIAWQQGFKAQAVAEGIDPRLFDTAFANISLNRSVIEADRFQPEFSKPIWAYLDSAVSPSRIREGRQNHRRLRGLLRRIENRYKVDSEVITAIWGLESNYGGNRGSIYTIEALATLAFDGRRARYGERQLIAALKILQAGDVSQRNMRGSWAGAMGHTQFIPTSFLALAVDWDGDGRRNIWGENPADALASAANYLHENGWVRGQPWGVEVILPEGFDYALADINNRQSAQQWQRLGVRRADGGQLPDYSDAALLLPAGAGNPVFAVYKNFRVIQRYNNSVSYAISVGNLSDRIGGGSGFIVPWARNAAELSRDQIIDLQTKLTARGFSTGGTDGIAGAKTRTAIIAFQQSIGIEVDGFASQSLLARLSR